MQVDRANRVEALTREVEELLRSRDLRFFGALPFSTVLASTRMDEVQASLKAEMEEGHSRTDVTVDNVSSLLQNFPCFEFKTPPQPLSRLAHEACV